MKRYLKTLTLVTLAIALVFTLTGCMKVETVPKEKDLSVLKPFKGNVLEQTHTIDGFELVTTYNTGNYDLSRWRITDSKTVNMTAQVRNVPEGTVVIVEHVHIDMSLKSTDPQLDGLTQDSMDDSYHGSSQDGFFISEKYRYENIFAVEGFSKDLIDGWMFVCGSYGSGTITQTRLTEKNLVQYGNVYANKIQVVYDILVKNAGEDYFHTISVLDEFLIPVEYEAEDK